MLVKNEKANLVHVNGIKLIPGVNKVDPVAWAKARKHPLIKAKLENGSITEEMNADLAEELGEETLDEAVLEHITTLTVSQAKQLVADTVDKQLLEGWNKADTRKAVREAIKKQIAKLDAEPEMRDRSQTRQISTGKGPDVEHLDARPTAQDD